MLKYSQTENICFNNKPTHQDHLIVHIIDESQFAKQKTYNEKRHKQEIKKSLSMFLNTTLVESF